MTDPVLPPDPNERARDVSDDDPAPERLDDDPSSERLDDDPYEGEPRDPHDPASSSASQPLDEPGAGTSTHDPAGGPAGGSSKDGPTDRDHTSLGGAQPSGAGDAPSASTTSPAPGSSGTAEDRDEGSARPSGTTTRDRADGGAGTGPGTASDQAAGETATTEDQGGTTAGAPLAPPPSGPAVRASTIHPPDGNPGDLPKNFDWEGPTLVWSRPRSGGAVAGVVLLVGLLPAVLVLAAFALGLAGDAGTAMFETAFGGWDDQTWLLAGIVVLILVLGLALSALIVARMGQLVRMDSEGVRAVTRSSKERWSVPWTGVQQIAIVDEDRKEGGSSERRRFIELVPRTGDTTATHITGDRWSLDDHAAIVATWYARGWVPDHVTYTERLPAFSQDVARAARKAEQEGRQARS